MIDERFIGRWAERLATEIPGAWAVLLKGSYVRGDAGPWSDVDFDVLVDDTEIVDPYLSWFDDTTGRVVHISVAVEHLTDWLARFAEPEDWAFGLAAQPFTRLVWVARPSLAAELDRPERTHPAGDPELEDFIEALGKARNAFLRGDELATRLALREVGNLTPSLLLPLNRKLVARTKPEAVRLLLDLEVAPPDYRDDLTALLCLDGRAHTIADLLETGERLVTGMLDLLEEHHDKIAPLLAPHLDMALRDGTIRRYLAQDSGTSPT
jgi:hypothetical protein